jgi:hypothetical protein
MGNRPAQAAMQAQQQQINMTAQKVKSLAEENDSLRKTVAKQGLVIDYIARVAGITEHVAAIHKQADAENPAQPVPNPPSQPATESTEEAVTPEAYDHPLAPGQTPGSVQDLPADTTGTPMDPGTTLPTAPYNELVDVQAPVSGTETQLPLEQTRTEVDVRVGDPMNPEVAYPWTTASQNRTVASLRLARLRIQAGTAEGDDIQVAASIEGDEKITTEAISHEIHTLEGVVRAAARRTQRPANVVPRSASVQRTAPSLVGGQQQGLVSEAALGSVSDDLENADIFLD